MSEREEDEAGSDEKMVPKFLGLTVDYVMGDIHPSLRKGRR